MGDSYQVPLPQPRPPDQESTSAWSLLSPEPLDQASPLGMQAAGGGGNDLVRHWIASQHQGPYERAHGTADLGPDFQVPRGQLTFDAEGTEGGRYHSRAAHVPSVGASGVTIGRGYDVGQHGSQQAIEALTGAGVSPEQAAILAEAAGKKQGSAQSWLAQNQGRLEELTPEQQKALFETTYGDMAADVQRISSKSDTRAAYGEVDLDAVDPTVRDLLVDLRYRGDYTPATRRGVQPLAAADDLAGMAAHLADRDQWSSVPADRFARRRDYAAEAVEEQQIARSLPYTFAAPMEHMMDPAYDLQGRRREE